MCPQRASADITESLPAKTAVLFTAPPPCRQRANNVLQGGPRQGEMAGATGDSQSELHSPFGTVCVNGHSGLALRGNPEV